MDVDKAASFLASALDDGSHDPIAAPDRTATGQ